MHTCIHAYMHTCMHAYMHICIHTCIHAYMHTCIHAYMHTCIHAYMHTCIHAYMHTYIHTYIHACIHTYIHICVCYICYIYNGLRAAVCYRSVSSLAVRPALARMRCLTRTLQCMARGILHCFAYRKLCLFISVLRLACLYSRVFMARFLVFM